MTNNNALVHPLAVHSLLCGHGFYTAHGHSGHARSRKRASARHDEAPLVLIMILLLLLFVVVDYSRRTPLLRIQVKRKRSLLFPCNRSKYILPENAPTNVGHAERQLALAVPQSRRPISPPEPRVVLLDHPIDLFLCKIPGFRVFLAAPAVALAAIVEKSANAAFLPALDDAVQKHLVLVDGNMRAPAHREVDSWQATGGTGGRGGLAREK